MGCTTVSTLSSYRHGVPCSTLCLVVEWSNTAQVCHQEWATVWDPTFTRIVVRGWQSVSQSGPKTLNLTTCHNIQLPMFKASIVLNKMVKPQTQTHPFWTITLPDHQVLTLTPGVAQQFIMPTEVGAEPNREGCLSILFRSTVVQMSGEHEQSSYSSGQHREWGTLTAF